MRYASTLLLSVLFWARCFAAEPATNIKEDYEIVFFPAVAHYITGDNVWQLEIHGCVYENNQRRLGLVLLREALELEGVRVTKTQAPLFNERGRLFMVDHKGGKRVLIKIGDRLFPASKTSANGKFSTVIRLSDAEVDKLKAESLEFQAVLPEKDKRVFKGTLSFAAPSGITVISDIDDTIKITHVHDRQATLRSTFLEPLRPVEGMAPLYRNWVANDGAQFFYVSASPWQLFLPLSDFVKSNGFPAGAFCLKDFRLKDRSLFSLFENPEKYKPGVIEPLFKSFPERKFILVGDSGERDPEIYGNLARRFRGQVGHIFIRNVSNEPAQSPRFQKAFRDLPAGVWTVFHDPSEIAAVKLNN